ncbi:MAG: flagellar export chaperone FliS [Planctomycetota bacterium]|nr:flagellar export chaperone FliS [Planctomycetota bacterium]
MQPQAPNTSVNAYLKSRVMSATPEQLRLMLLDGALRFAAQGRDGLAKKDYEASFTGLTGARDILMELITSIRTDVDPELMQRIKALYTFMYSELVSAGLERDPARVDKVIELLTFERETWSLLCDKVAEERRATSGGTPASAPTAAPAHAAPVGKPMASISIQG